MHPELITPLAITALVLWGMYRRVRRSFGRQPVEPRRLWSRVVMLSLVGVLILVSSVHDVRASAALLAGLACGCALGYLGLRHTRFEVTPEGRFYTPHTYIGLIVTALFVGRLLYRLTPVFAGVAPGSGGIPPSGPPANPFSGIYQNPLTLVTFGLVVSYYVLYNLGVLTRTRSGPSSP